MGSDDLFHKRKARSLDTLKRKIAKRDPYDVVLIVSEGSKTEPSYFEEIKTKYRLNNSNIEVTGKCGSAPISVVDKAIELFNENPDYDRVYCLFDRDNHETYYQALEEISRTTLTKSDGETAHFEAINSNLCFEYWLLLHFTYTTKPYLQAMSRSKSISELVIDDLKAYIPNYKKNDDNTFSKTKEHLHNAIKSSKSVLAHAERLDEENPSTKVHVLVEYLINLKK